MGVLNRNRYRIAALAEELRRRGFERRPVDVVAERCRQAGLTCRMDNDGTDAPVFVAVDVHPEVAYLAFVAIEPARSRTPGLSGWRVWCRTAEGRDRFREGDPEHGVWVQTIPEAIEIAARWQRPQVTTDQRNQQNA
jgi:hypothetical protein